MRHSALLLAFVLSMTVITASAVGAVPFKGSTPAIRALPVSSNSQLIGSDGIRHLLVVAPAAGTAPRTWYDVDIASRTRSIVSPPGDSCSVVAAGRGGLAAQCAGGDRNLIYLSGLPFDAWTAYDVPTEVLVGGATDFTVTGVGTHWLQLAVDGNHYAEVPVWVSRDDARVERGLSSFVDLNSAALAVTVCKRLRSASLVGYSAPWAIGGSWRTTPSSLTIRSCNSAKSRVLTKHAERAQLSGSLAAWSYERDAGVANLATGAVQPIRIPGAKAAALLVGRYVLAQRNAHDQFSGEVGIVRLPEKF